MHMYTRNVGDMQSDGGGGVLCEGSFFLGFYCRFYCRGSVDGGQSRFQGSDDPSLAPRETGNLTEDCCNKVLLVPICASGGSGASGLHLMYG